MFAFIVELPSCWILPKGYTYAVYFLHVFMNVQFVVGVHGSDSPSPVLQIVAYVLCFTSPMDNQNTLLHNHATPPPTEKKKERKKV